MSWLRSLIVWCALAALVSLNAAVALGAVALVAAAGLRRGEPFLLGVAALAAALAALAGTAGSRSWRTRRLPRH